MLAMLPACTLSAWIDTHRDSHVSFRIPDKHTILSCVLLHLLVEEKEEEGIGSGYSRGPDIPQDQSGLNIIISIVGLESNLSHTISRALA